ncbi:hypothetical protein ACFQ5F_04415 [Kroppenstedtia eburnea]|uniref:Glyoxalase/Bleomycin resistance protein/Dioxygenase superfamily protein n=1 Tax=Kroppenstedtia eburnea TaxID=714067 RepID=A0A1N7LNG2_9BACL|nr:hypothetical protein [Kroppenstedtia eburnea]QKI81241.1 hypothetical protein GXN75_04085 [Kroppenstedtia eburnea]SIS75322.1 hypothetical protein SAMN05421790_104287 [Kroppenstedtia eburnea]
MSDALLLYVLRVIDLDRSLTFYRDMLRFNPVSYDPEQRTARLFTPDGGILFLTTDPDLDVAALLRQEEAGGPGETPAPMASAEDEEVPPPEREEEPVDPMVSQESEPESSSPFHEILEVDKEEGLHFPGEDLMVAQERLAAFGIPDLLLEETPGVEQVLKMEDPDGYRVCLHESLRLTDEEVIALYHKGPDLLEGAILGLEEEDLDLKTPEGESLRQLILQIVDFDLEMMQRVKWAMAENGRSYTIPLYPPEEWAQALQYDSRSVQVEVQLFRLLREHILHQVEAVPEAMDHHLVSEQGSVEVRTMLQVVAETAREQIQTILNVRHQYGK